MGQAPILAYMCYEKLLKFFGKRKPRKSADKSHDERRSYPISTCRLDHRCRCYERSVTVTYQSRSAIMTKGRDRGQEKPRGLSVQTNPSGHACTQVVHSVQSHHGPIFRQESPSHSYPSHSQNSISSCTPRRKPLDSMASAKPKSPVTSCRSCQLAQELCLRQEGIRRDFVLDLPRSVARCPDDGPLRWPSRPGVSPHPPPTTICHPPPNLNPFLDTRLAPSEHL